MVAATRSDTERRFQPPREPFCLIRQGHHRSSRIHPLRPTLHKALLLQTTSTSPAPDAPCLLSPYIFLTFATCEPSFDLRLAMPTETQPAAGAAAAAKGKHAHAGVTAQPAPRKVRFNVGA